MLCSVCTSHEEPTAPTLASNVEAWLASRDCADALLLRWQALESMLFREHGVLSAREASRRGIQVGTEMRLLEIRHRALSRELAARASQLCGAPSSTPSDALAKIELGLRLQELEPDDLGFQFIRCGLTELRGKAGL